MNSKSCQVFAPSTIANLNVGFDLLGLALEKKGDRITVELIDEPKVILDIPGNNKLPKDAQKNTAGLPLINLIKKRKLSTGFKVKIEKGIPLCSGLGGSAASAVGAIFAANQLLSQPLSNQEVYTLALDGEELASGARHGDNIAPCLYGGLVMAGKDDLVESIPFPDEIQILMIHPRVEIPTSEARSQLATDLPLAIHIEQSQYLTQFIGACHKGHAEKVLASMKDVCIEPQRASMIPNYQQMKALCLQQGLQSFGISGAGPACFSMFDSRLEKDEVLAGVKSAFQTYSIEADIWLDRVNIQGPKILHSSSGDL